jgi:ABC-2 type transport system ATP-binding protein
MEEVVLAKGIKKSFKGRSALSGVDLSIKQGQLYGLVGPNGAGKTTLIRTLCGLLKPDEGEAWVLGWRVPNFRIRSQIGYMPQEVALYPDLTVMKNLGMFGELYDIPRGQLRERAKELLALVQLLDRWNQKVGTLSGGMQRRASLAVSLLHKPRLLFLDEPTSGVDPRLRQAFWDHFGQLAREDVSLIVTTHLMEEAGRCHVIGFINQGRLIAEGSPEDLLSRTGAHSLEEAFTKLEDVETP